MSGWAKRSVARSLNGIGGWTSPAERVGAGPLRFAFGRSFCGIAYFMAQPSCKYWLNPRFRLVAGRLERLWGRDQRLERACTHWFWAREKDLALDVTQQNFG